MLANQDVSVYQKLAKKLLLPFVVLIVLMFLDVLLTVLIVIGLDL